MKATSMVIFLIVSFWIFVTGCSVPYSKFSGKDINMQVQFTEVLIDSLGHGDDKAIADIDNDNIKDIILGGSSLTWYRNENGAYVKYKIIDPKVEFTTDMRTDDVDNDGDIDLIVADGKDSDNVMWYEPPFPKCSPFKVRHGKNMLSAHMETGCIFPLSVM